MLPLKATDQQAIGGLVEFDRGGQLQRIPNVFNLERLF
jgi:hypothetical protein